MAPYSVKNGNFSNFLKLLNVRIPGLISLVHRLDQGLLEGVVEGNRVSVDW